MIPRIVQKKIKQLAKQFKAVAIIGPRQSGKTTLVRNIFPDLLSYLQQNLDEDQRRGKFIFHMFSKNCF